MIVASHFGWQTVSPDPPTWHDFLLMAQLMSEERVGARARASSGRTAAHESDREARLRMYRE